MGAQSAKTLDVPEAGRIYFGLGRNASYDAAKRGEIPVIKIGGRLRVPVIALERMLDEAGVSKAPAGYVNAPRETEPATRRAGGGWVPARDGGTQ
jgi:hypothetical protein